MRQHLLHCAVFIELSAGNLDKLRELQSDVSMEMTREKISVDHLSMRQKEGFIACMPCGYNIFGTQYERVLPASAVANLFPFNYSGKTDKNGELTVPEVEQTERHGVYIVGYTDGTFGPSRSMTRSEAAAIFARLLAEKNGDTISTAANTKFADIPAHAWYSGYVKYLSNNGITYGKSKTIFAPNDAITRAEFTTMAVRFFDVYGDGDAEIMEQFSGFNDVSSGYWAAEYIKYAALHGWINGYGDGSFHADREINRAEVVTIVNRLLGREADEDYIADNLRKLNTFPDVSRKHWAYYAVMEAANAHTAVLGESESWSK